VYIKLLEMKYMDPGNEVFHVLDETPEVEVEVGKSGENNEIERRGILTLQFWVGCRMDWKAVDVKVLELGCCRQTRGEDI